LHRRDRALEGLEARMDRRQMPLSALKGHPIYDPLCHEPRFQALLVRIPQAPSFYRKTTP